MSVFENISDELIFKQYKRDNYLIIEDQEARSDICCVYFSSNALPFPETEENFKTTIVDRDKYEWFSSKISNVKISIFVRDITKNFYCEGINDRLNSMQKLIEWIREKSRGLKLITVGSSAGGYAACVVGIMLQAYAVYDFSGQINLFTYFDLKNKRLLLRHIDDISFNWCYNLRDLIQGNSSTLLFYVTPLQSAEDREQIEYLSKNEYNFIVPIISSIHGVPLYHSCISNFINTSPTINKLIIGDLIINKEVLHGDPKLILNCQGISQYDFARSYLGKRGAIIAGSKEYLRMFAKRLRSLSSKGKYY